MIDRLRRLLIKGGSPIETLALCRRAADPEADGMPWPDRFVAPGVGRERALLLLQVLDRERGSARRPRDLSPDWGEASPRPRTCSRLAFARYRPGPRSDHDIDDCNRQAPVVGAPSSRRVRMVRPRLRVITGGGRSPAPLPPPAVPLVVLRGGLLDARARCLRPRPWKSGSGARRLMTQSQLRTVPLGITKVLVCVHARLEYLARLQKEENRLRATLDAVKEANSLTVTWNKAAEAHSARGSNVGPLLVERAA